MTTCCRSFYSWSASLAIISRPPITAEDRLQKQAGHVQQLYCDQGKANPHYGSHGDPGYDYSAALFGCDRSGNQADHDRVVGGEHQINKNDLKKRTDLIEQHMGRQ